MDKTYIIIIIALVILVAADFASRKFFTEKQTDDKEEIKKSTYRYFAKSYIMTQREKEFFRQLNDMLGSKWYIIPQVHLSALLNHKVKGQNWNAAFRHINGKSVDYVLLSKETGKPVCAIELDDASHDSKSRAERDAEVERIFKAANIPLARFRNPEKCPAKKLLASSLRQSKRHDIIKPYNTPLGSVLMCWLIRPNLGRIFRYFANFNVSITLTRHTRSCILIFPFLGSLDGA